VSDSAESEYLFTSESVTEGHPDKIADQISDGVLDAVLADDPDGRVACETLVNTGLIVVSGEISTSTYVDIPAIARETVRRIGYDNAVYGFDCNTCAVINAIDRQSPDIAQGVNAAYEARTAHSSDALDLAKHGVVSMLVDMPWSQKDWFNTRTTNDDYAGTVAQVIALRRALDCLGAIPGVDKSRIAYVGHDFGAMVGVLLLAVDNRPSYAVLMAPTLSFWEWYLLGKQPADPAAYVAQMSVFDLPGWLAKGRQKATLLQVGQLDEYVSQATGIAIRNAIPARGRTLRAYKLDHALEDETTHEDRLTWLVTQLAASP